MPCRLQETGQRNIGWCHSANWTDRSPVEGHLGRSRSVWLGCTRETFRFRGVKNGGAEMLYLGWFAETHSDLHW